MLPISANKLDVLRDEFTVASCHKAFLGIRGTSLIGCNRKCYKILEINQKAANLQLVDIV